MNKTEAIKRALEEYRGYLEGCNLGDERDAQNEIEYLIDYLLDKVTVDEENNEIELDLYLEAEEKLSAEFVIWKKQQIELENSFSLFKVENLWAEFVDEKARHFDFSSGWTSSWDYYAASRCDKCGLIVSPVIGGECRHRDVDGDTDCDGYLYADGPMMNFEYPVDVNRVGGEEEAAKRLADLPVVLVQWLDDGYTSEEWSLALTGGGMDLSWEICEAYTRLGYLPPVEFCDVQDYGRRGERERYVLEACRKSYEVVEGRASRGKGRVDDLLAEIDQAE